MLLFCFGYSWPAEVERWHKDESTDLGEASSLLFIAESDEQIALHIGEEVAEQFVRQLFAPAEYSWRRDGFARWIEHDPVVLDWARLNEVPIVFNDTTAEITRVVSELTIRGERSVT